MTKKSFNDIMKTLSSPTNMKSNVRYYTDNLIITFFNACKKVGDKHIILRTYYTIQKEGIEKPGNPFYMKGQGLTNGMDKSILYDWLQLDIENFKQKNNLK